MGAVCYKPKPTNISKEEVLRALQDKHLKQCITEPEGYKTLKTEEIGGGNLLTLGTLSQSLQTKEDANSVKGHGMDNQKLTFTVMQKANGSRYNKNIELNIMTYFGHKEEIYETLATLSKKTLYYMRKNYNSIEQVVKLKHCNEKIRFALTKTIEEHQSGVNQMMKLNSKELVTASDDCFLKFWSSQSLKVEASIPSETITCIAITGGSNPQNKEILVAGCHSGNLLIISISQRAKKDQINSAHYNLIRVIVTLEALKNKYFVTADVCGIVKVWSSSFKPQQIMEIEQSGAISYNSMIEITDFLPRRGGSSEDSALIACALKSHKVNLILLTPSIQKFQVLKTLKTNLKPTCLIQLTHNHLAIAVGSLKEDSSIGIYNINKNQLVSTLLGHKDMIDSLLKLEFPQDRVKHKNPYVSWFASASRDRKIMIWKVVGGKVMRRNQAFMLASNVKQANQQSNNTGVRSFAEIKKSKQSMNQKEIPQTNKHKSKKKQRPSDEDEDQQLLEEEAEQEEEEYESEVEKQINDSDEEQKEQPVDIPTSPSKGNSKQQQDQLQDYYYSIDTGHKDFVRSMIQVNSGGLLISASEDKTIKVFSIAF